MFEFFGAEGSLAIVSILTIPVAFSFMVVYVMGALRRDRAESPDRFLGARVFLLLLLSMAFQIVLLGMAQMFAASMGDPPAPGGAFAANADDRQMDQAMGLFLGGAIAGIYPLALYVLVRLRDGRSDSVFRAALGVNAIITGLWFVMNVTLMMSAMMMDDEQVDEFTAMTVVYLGGSLLCSIPLALAVPLSNRSTMPPPPRF